MIEEMKVARIDNIGGPESSTSVTEPNRSVPFIELRNTFASDLNLVSPLLDRLMPFISRFRGRDESNFEIELALREALVNAIVHGNQEHIDKRVYLSCRSTTDGEVSITIQDEGHGFDVNAVPDPTTQENLFRGSGRGIYVMKTLMDEVRFEQRGTVVHMRKWSKARPTADGEAI
jgi:serine/threonine-protein kinase RsbW